MAREAVEAALAGVPQEVARRGKPGVVVVSAAEFARLSRVHEKRQPSLLEAIASCPDPDFDFTSDRPNIVLRDIEF